MTKRFKKLASRLILSTQKPVNETAEEISTRDKTFHIHAWLHGLLSDYYQMILENEKI